MVRIPRGQQIADRAVQGGFFVLSCQRGQPILLYVRVFRMSSDYGVKCWVELEAMSNRSLGRPMGNASMTSSSRIVSCRTVWMGSFDGDHDNHNISLTYFCYIHVWLHVGILHLRTSLYGLTSERK